MSSDRSAGGLVQEPVDSSLEHLAPLAEDVSALEQDCAQLVQQRLACRNELDEAHRWTRRGLCDPCTVDGLWDAIRRIVDTFTTTE